MGSARVQRSKASASSQKSGDEPRKASAPVQKANSAPAIVSRAPALAVPVQRKVAMGAPGDAFEQEAESVAGKVASGGAVSPDSISRVTASDLAQSATASTNQGGNEQKPSKPVQKASAQGDPKRGTKPPKSPVQKADAKKPEPSLQRAESTPATDKKPASGPSNASPDKPAVQRRVDKPGEKTDSTRMLQQAANPEKKADPSGKSAAQGAKPKTAQTAEKKPEKPSTTGAAQKAEKPNAGTDKKSAPAVQRAEDDADDSSQNEPLQKAASGGGAASPAPAAPAAAPAVAEQAIAGRGAGAPLQSGTRAALESSLGADFTDVRVHEDSRAREAAHGLEARAFTHGSDIWLGPGESQNDLHLMAHEATHVLQQDGDVRCAAVQRAGEENATSSGAEGGDANAGGSAAAGEVDPEAKRIEIPILQVPNYERKANSIPTPLNLPRQPTRPHDQRQVWSRAIAADGGYKSAVRDKVRDQPGVESTRTGKKIYFLEPSNRRGFVVAGDADSLIANLTLPTWDSDGAFHRFDVDHIREMQLGGENLPENMELLDASANRSSGSRIRNEVTSKISATVAPHVGSGKIWSRSPDPRDVQREYQVTFAEKTLALEIAGDPNTFWSLSAVKGGRHLDPVRVLGLQEIEQRGLRGDPTHLKIYPSERGGAARNVPWEPGITEKSLSRANFFRNFDLASVSYTPGVGGAISGTKFRSHKVFEGKPVTWALTELGGLDYTAVVDRARAASSLANLNVKGASLLELSEPYLDEEGGLMATGVLRPTLPLLGPVEIDVSISSDDVELSKTFSAGELNLPGPIHITESSLTLTAGTAGLGISGEVRFKVDRVGQGHIAANISNLGQTGLEMSGGFEFDTELFDQAAIDVWYRDSAFGGSGTIAITRPGKIKGIRAASIRMTIDQGAFSATGTVQPQIPGVQEAGLTVAYSEAEGLTIGGSLQLADVPGISSGSLNVTLQKKPDGTWKVSGTGTATPNIPGVATQLNITYDDGFFDINGTAAYSRGMLSGSLTVGVTNRPVSEGQPAGEPGNTFTLYGGGTLTLQIAPWLQATAGIRLLPNGELEVTGRIGLPSALDLFPEKKLEKTLFSIGVDIPIVGVAVAGQRIGIFANITGGLTLSAGIGPGQLQDLHLEVTYNPSHEDQTVVSGGANLHVPAQAGLRLFVRGGLGAGIPIVSAQAGLEIGGQLGLEGALDAGVDVNWTPATGLVLDASAEIYVQPVFKFDITGFVLVEADLLLTTIELYNKRWQLAAFEWGSNLRFGVRLPVHYEEGKPFDLSFDDLEFTVPDIDPMAMLSDLVGQIA